MALALWIRRLAFTGLVLCLIVVVLGAYVRLTAAGLGCPDWPGCYGAPTPLGIGEDASAQAHFPQTPVNVGKAWREMAHRYAAGTLGLIIAALALLAATRRGRQMIGLRFGCALLAILILQASLGMLTVTLRLTPLVVTLHLIFGMTTLALLAWLWLSVKGPGGADAARASPARLPRRLALAALIVLAMQIALGGWTSSNYAATACPDFPTCQGRWWPATDYAHAFVPWTGLGVDYEGGVLAGPARAAIQLTHRLGACAATLMLVLAASVTLKGMAARAPRRAAGFVLAFLLLQLVMAVAMVEKGFPLLLTTAHNAGAALLLLATVALYQALNPLPAGRQGPGG
jgi:cytochrome c oxidase assembly protein subunit 15